MAITAKDVQKLREMTGVGMMDCKKAEGRALFEKFDSGSRRVRVSFTTTIWR